MEILKILKRLDESKDFKEWKEKNKDSFLAHVFKMIDDANKDDWQIGYYNKDDTMTTFILTPDRIVIASTDKIFKKPGVQIKGLDKEKIKTDITEALQTAEKIQVTEYKNEPPTKIITILQKLDMGQIYNITYVTQSLKVLNFKIDSSNGKVLKKSIKSIMDFKAS